MLEAVASFAILAAPAIGVVVAVYVIARSVLNFSVAEKRRGKVVLKAVVSLAVWMLASWGMVLMLFVGVHSAAHAEDRAAERWAVMSLLVFDLVYILIGCGLALWVRHRTGNRTRCCHWRAQPNMRINRSR